MGAPRGSSSFLPDAGAVAKIWSSSPRNLLAGPGPDVASGPGDRVTGRLGAGNLDLGVSWGGGSTADSQGSPNAVFSCPRWTLHRAVLPGSYIRGSPSTSHPHPAVILQPGQPCWEWSVNTVRPHFTFGETEGQRKKVTGYIPAASTVPAPSLLALLTSPAQACFSRKN